MSLSLDIIRTHMGKKQANAHDVFFVGRGIDYAICMEDYHGLEEK